ncbi:uncharacterized protein LAJ45_09334 [Morchella importuna]|uniref:uncharacterized protein n=1 Tax=Morchella importuna TaxID=1174673 RepID=UPI001E8ECA7C|nr:uncharacterized protein LAJ45_09334 [Morchella importuna]KAH8146651.1 hypothetical protein LAJ45_09334 [Morchella importuna]
MRGKKSKTSHEAGRQARKHGKGRIKPGLVKRDDQRIEQRGWLVNKLYHTHHVSRLGVCGTLDVWNESELHNSAVQHVLSQKSIVRVVPRYL